METVLVVCPRCCMCGEQAIVQVLADDLERYKAGAKVQVAFPEMPPPQRELLVSGTHPECWEKLWGPDE